MLSAVFSVVAARRARRRRTEERNLQLKEAGRRIAGPSSACSRRAGLAGSAKENRRRTRDDGMVNVGSTNGSCAQRAPKRWATAHGCWSAVWPWCGVRSVVYPGGVHPWCTVHRCTPVYTPRVHASQVHLTRRTGDRSPPAHPRRSGHRAQ